MGRKAHGHQDAKQVSGQRLQVRLDKGIRIPGLGLQFQASGEYACTHMHMRQGHTSAPTVCAPRGLLPGCATAGNHALSSPVRPADPRRAAQCWLRLFVMLIPFPTSASCLHNGRPEPRQP